MHGSRGGGWGHGYQPPTPTHPAKFKFFKKYTGMCASREISHERFHVKFTTDTTGRVHYKIMKKICLGPPGPLANSNNRRNRIRALYTCKWTSKHSQTVLVMITCTLTERHMYMAYHFISNLGKFYHPCLSQFEAPT